MRRSVFGGLMLLICSLPVVAGAPQLAENSRVLPMQFSLQSEGPTDLCGAKCRIWIFAAGMVTADTPRQFESFVRDHEVRGATVVLDSDGGSVHGALALGRAIRRLGLSTTIGRRLDRRAQNAAGKRGETWSRADCESMCAFVLLGGVRRDVPIDARVLVHQIWLGDRREDPTAASYSAEDLVLVQRDIGKLVQYTVEMGGSAELLELALRIPPWEPMRALSREELRRMHLDTRAEAGSEAGEQALNSAASAPVPVRMKQEVPTAVNDRGWGIIDRSGRSVLARRHPLTYEGERIGTFDLILTCAEAPGTYALTYVETRSGPAGEGVPRFLKQVQLWIDQADLSLKIVSSETKKSQLETVATAALPASVARAFADGVNRSLTVETASGGNPATMIRIGNTGFARNFAQFESGCGQAQRTRRDAHARLDQAQGQ